MWKCGEGLRALPDMLTLLIYAPQYFAKCSYKPVKKAGYGLLKAILPVSVRRRLLQWRGFAYNPPVGHVQFGDLRRVTPLSQQFGYDRGLPIDRYYIEGFLDCHRQDIRGHVLEIGDDAYTREFGGEQVVTNDVLHVVEGNTMATIVADLTCADHISSNTFDCIILTQTLHLIYDIRSAVQTPHRILKPGGILLATVPGISQISQDEWGESWYWAFTILSIQRLFEERFPVENINVQAYGNVLAATGFLQGLAVEELNQRELDYYDPHYQVLITLRAVKPVVTA